MTTPSPPEWARHPLRRLVRRAGTHRWLLRVAPPLVRAENWLRRHSGNKLNLIGVAGLTSLQLTVPGRRSGTPRTVSLLAVPEPGGYLLVGSNWARPAHPAWSSNLLAVDEVAVRVGTRDLRMRVRLLADADRSAAWAAALAYWPGYQMEYEVSDGREFRLFRLEFS